MILLSLINMGLKTALYILITLACVHCSVVLHGKETQIVALKNHNNGQGNVSFTIPDKYIAGGHPAQVGQFPWMARLSIKDRSDDSKYLCGGSLIADRHVLTAAHCMAHEVEHLHDIEIYLGEYDRNSFPTDCVKGKCIKNWLVYPDKVVKHTNFDMRTLSNDIALLRLEKRALFSAHIKPIPLPPFDIDKPKNKGSSVAVVGWGKTEESVTSNILLTTEISMIPKSECLKTDPGVPSKHFCAGDPKGKDTCPGDSGGPLLMYYKEKYYLSGIVSYGPDVKCGTAKMGYYTNVYKYMKWIKRILRIHRLR